MVSTLDLYKGRLYRGSMRVYRGYMDLRVFRVKGLRLCN